MNDFTDLQGNDVNEFITNYRGALEQQRDLSKQQLEQQRKNDFASIMSNANTKGMLYSNFPARDKVKYDATTYQPAVVKAQQSYQTGLDKLRSNALNAWNNIQTIQENINHLNELDSISNSGSSTSTTPSTTTGVTNTAKVSQNGADFQFTDSKGNPITFYEYAADHGQIDAESLKSALSKMQSAGDQNALHALAAMNNVNNQMTAEEKTALEALGIPTSGFTIRQ